METGKLEGDAYYLKYSGFCQEIDRLLRKKTADGTKLFKCGPAEILRVEEYREDESGDINEYHAFGFYIDIINLEGERGFRTWKPIVKSMLIENVSDNKTRKEGRWQDMEFIVPNSKYEVDRKFNYLDSRGLAKLIEKIKDSKPLRI